MCYLEAIALNNHGVSLLGKGRFYKGYEVLKHALQCLDEEATNEQNQYQYQQQQQQQQQQHYQNEMNLHSQGNHNPRVHFTYSWVDFSEEKNHSQPSSSSSSSATLPQHSRCNNNSSNIMYGTNEVCAPFLCKHGVKINVDDNSGDGVSMYFGHYDQYDCDAKLRWAIIYNLAISNHLAASCLGERGSFLLQQAHQYYTAAQLAIPNTVSYDDCFRLLLATQNNLICIYLDFGMHAEHHSSLKILTELLMSLPNQPPTIEEESPTDSMNHEILLNLMVLSRRHIAPAA